ncbi:DNA helicase [Pseudoxanthomonas kalamensis DSM 18571]|uniref:DEAD/DEAH box helicase n=1 Tax=Pseudoxanthomonas kalamensis TaxID=289483 RepID=UPI001391D6BC|nr:DEAD/DEAH box helicase [Pseudoxanthomonas kalamensis]KAF1711093.1 DNA helicase [Pseudoxanthomonas kalamensis DSM 18571]
MQLRPYQSAALSTCWDYLRNRTGNPAIVLPTGAGKSPLMAAIARDAYQNWGGRVGVIAHTQELVGQNFDKFRKVAPDLPAGIYSASLNRRDRFDPIMFMQIQSVAHRADALGKFDLLLIDEGHRIPLKGEGRYRRFIEGCRRWSPNLRVVILTATPYRLQGQAVPICGPDYIATEIAYEARIPDLIADGYLSPLISIAGDNPDLSAVHLKGGEYIEDELADAMIRLVERTADDLVRRAAERRAIIVFCVNVAHAEAVRDALTRRGVATGLVHGGTPKGERTALLDQFQDGQLRAMVNVNVLSEGFDAPHIDCVVMLRPTKSPGMYYQQVGRGFRMAPGKANCLVLDYAGNVLEHGPVDQIRVRTPRPGKAAEVQAGKAKQCPGCETLLPFGTRTCPECGHQFTHSAPDHLDRPVNAPVLSSERERVVVSLPVSSVKYERHVGKGGKLDSMRATYQCGLRRVHEWICVEHGGFAGRKALEWWIRRDPAGVPPRTVEEALGRAYGLPTPARITVDETDKYPQVLGCEWDAEAVAEQQATTLEARKTPAWLAEAMSGLSSA